MRQSALLAVLMAACAGGIAKAQPPPRVEILRQGDNFTLLRNGKPYVARGAGLGGGGDVSVLAQRGGNSVRTWSTRPDGVDAMQLLDTAHAHGVTVALGLPMQAERSGFDYNDKQAVAEQFARVRADVLRYRHHPALLVWIIGNELNHFYSNPAVFDAVNAIAQMIHELDGRHPTTTALAGFDEPAMAEIARRAPAIDFLSFQVYGGIFDLASSMAESNFNQPFMVTEWGTLGYWEQPQTAWGAPLEISSTEKAAVFLRAYEEILRPLEQGMLGSYAFLWGQKQERTPTWFSLFTERAEPTEAVDVLQYMWTGSWPENRAPQLLSITLDDRDGKDSMTLQPGVSYRARSVVADPEGGPIAYRWELKPESAARTGGGDPEQPIASIAGAIQGAEEAEAMVTAPGEGAYRLLLYAADNRGQTAHGNIPFYVSGPGN